MCLSERSIALTASKENLTEQEPGIRIGRTDLETSADLALRGSKLSGEIQKNRTALGDFRIQRIERNGNVDSLNGILQLTACRQGIRGKDQRVSVIRVRLERQIEFGFSGVPIELLQRMKQTDYGMCSCRGGVESQRLFRSEPAPSRSDSPQAGIRSA